MSLEALQSWQMIATKRDFEFTKTAIPKLNTDEVILCIAGCGVCHTDLSFWHFGVKTRKELPLTLGHEISGTIVEGAPELIGKKVIVPAVLPCGECDLCNSGRSNICRKQLMPGNDFNGGFASHVKVPARFLCEVKDEMLKKISLQKLAVVADAVSTPYQAIIKSELLPGDLAIIIGVGGIGIYGAQIAKAKGAKIIALDVDDGKLRKLQDIGITGALNIKNMDGKAIKNKVKDMAKDLGAPPYAWKVFEMSGTKTGQVLGFNLLTFAGTLSVIGFTMNEAEIRLSNLMAFDAKAIGTWGCRAELYPEILSMIEAGQIEIDPFVETIPMSKINEVFKNTLEHKYTRRSILIPDFGRN